MERRYRVRDFAGITGVTVKALQHYGRLGLLRPSRTPAGHRIYNDRDVERLRQIVALKSIGVPLKRIRSVLDKQSVRRWMEFRFPEITRFLGKAAMAAFKRHGAQFFAPSSRAD